MRVGSVFWNATEHRPRALWRLVLQTLLVGVLVLAPLVFVGEWVSDLHKSGAFLPNFSHGMFDKVMDFAFGPGFAVLLLASVAIAGRFIDRRKWRDFGYQLDRAWWSDFWFGTGLGLGMVALIFAAENAMGWVRVEARGAPATTDVPLALLWAFIVVKALCVGTYEEALSRGYHLKNIAEGLNGIAGLSASGAAIAAMLLTSFAFSALHLATDNFTTQSLVGLTLNGMLLALPVLLTGRLAMSMSIHMSWNFAQGALFGYPVSGDFEKVSLLLSTATGPADWTGGAYGPEAGFLGWLAWGAGAIAILAWVISRSGIAVILPVIATYRPR